MSFCCARVAPDEPGSRRFVGLRNPADTCHLNVVLQAMFMTPELREGLLSCNSPELPQAGRAVATVFEKLEQSSRAVSTKQIAVALKPNYIVNEQQDCHDTCVPPVAIASRCTA